MKRRANGAEVALRREMSMKAKKKVFIFCFLLPGIAVFALIYAYPLASIFATSFTNWNFKNLGSPEFLGASHLFDNYVKLFTTDYFFESSLLNSLKWIGLQLAIQVPLAVIVALVLSRKIRGWVFVRNSFIIPNIISSAAIGLIFLNMYNPATGMITEIIRIFDPDTAVNILANPTTAFWGVTFAFVLFAGSSSLLVLAQILAIPKELFEAAKMDGATSLKADLHVTLPLIRPIIGTIAILAANYGLLLFNEIALISRGGPDGATYSMGYYIYQTAMGSSKLNFALANTAGVIQFITGIILIGLLTWIFKTNKSQYN